jgi:hypothetical protein
LLLLKPLGAARRKHQQSALQMTSEERKQIRQWIEDEGELLKAEDTKHEPLSDQLVPLIDALLDRLIEKHEISDSEQYDGVRKLMRGGYKRQRKSNFVSTRPRYASLPKNRQLQTRPG